jgi:hypothetical protein
MLGLGLKLGSSTAALPALWPSLPQGWTLLTWAEAALLFDGAYLIMEAF